MAVKDDFTTEEWAQVAAGPVMAGMYVIMSSMGVTSILGETKAMMDAIMKGERPAGSEDLINAIMADMQAKSGSGEKLEMPQLPEGAEKDPQAAMASVMDQVSAASTAVETKMSAGTAAGYNQWLYSVAVATPEAAKEGGFMGIGGQRVSEKEQAALDSLKLALQA